MATSAKSVQVVKDQSKAMQKAIEALTGSSVYAGIPSTKVERTEDDGSKAPINNAVIGYVQEHGLPEHNVPARPFLVPGIRDAAAKITAIFKKMGQNALQGNTKAVEAGMHAAGMVAQAAVKARITAGIPPKLADATLAARRRRGRTGETPLIDTGQLLNSVTYVVRDE